MIYDTHCHHSEIVATLKKAAYSVKTYASIAEVPASYWDSVLAGRTNAYSRAFWSVIEKAKLNDFTYRYVIFFDENDQPAALVCFYSITTDIAIFAPKWLRQLLGVIRRIFPRFLKFRMLECGTPVTVSSPPLVTRDDIQAQSMIAPLHKLLLNTAKEEGQWFIVIRDFEPDAQTLQADFRQLGYHWVDSLPNTHMDITWPTLGHYHAAMKSYYRSKLHRHLRKCAAQNIRYELKDDFHDLAETLCAQWLVVHHGADEFQREILTPVFYRELSLQMKERSKVLLFYQEDTLIGHALLLLDAEQLRWLYFGRKDAANDSLYIYAAHKVVEAAILLGVKKLEMGLTTYSVKMDLGAQMTSIKLAVRSPLCLINVFVGLGYKLLNRPPKLQSKSIFKT